MPGVCRVCGCVGVWVSVDILNGGGEAKSRPRVVSRAMRFALRNEVAAGVRSPEFVFIIVFRFLAGEELAWAHYGCACFSGVNGMSLPSEVLFNHGPSSQAR